MEAIPEEALDALDAAADRVDRLSASGLEIHFERKRFGRRLRAFVRDEDGQTLAELGLQEALDVISA